jgi:hypothetical protein
MRNSLEIEVGDYLFDHHFEDRCVLPAVEALEFLAKVVLNHFSEWNVSCLTKARFPRFLIIPPGTHHLPAMVEVDNNSNMLVSARMMTSMRSKTGGIGRNLEHTRVEFPLVDPSLNSRPLFPETGKQEGDSFIVPAESIYPGLIPFGKAFQNISGPVSLWPEEASSSLAGGDCATDDGRLGSPFPFDAVFHLACIWGQRFTGYVLFPVGFEKRTIRQKTKKDGPYLGRIFPAGGDRNVFLFDALIVDSRGVVYEEIRGIQMQDVSQGRLRPPVWIKELKPA